MAIANVFNSNGGTGVIAGGGTSVEYTVTDQTSITINHTFTTLPNVFVLDASGNLVSTDIQYVSSTQLLINFVISFTGKVVLR